MLPRKRRLSTKLFQEVMSGGRSFHGPHFSLRIYKTPGKPSSFGFSIPKKLDTRATKRNMLKRKCVSILRKYIKNIPDGTAGIFFAKKGAFEISSKELEEEVGSLIKKAYMLAS